jgi:hypothetical protein
MIAWVIDGPSRSVLACLLGSHLRREEMCSNISECGVLNRGPTAYSLHQSASTSQQSAVEGDDVISVSLKQAAKGGCTYITDVIAIVTMTDRGRKDCMLWDGPQ